MSALLKKPKTENVEVIDDDDDDDEQAAAATNKMTEENGDPDSRQEQEEALVALIEHRTREVHHLRQRVSYYKSQLEEAEKRLNDSETKLARLRRQDKVGSTKSSPGSGTKSAKVEPRSSSPIHLSEGSTRNQPHSKTELLIPAVIPKISQPTKLAGSCGKAPVSSSAQTSPSVSSQSISANKQKGDKSYRTSSKQEVEIQDRGTKRKFEQKEHKELIPLVRTSSSPCIIRCYASNHISSQHKRKLRSLSLCPVNDQLFVTSALDGIVNLWQVQAKGSGASLLSSTDCVAPKQRRWPEDIAWHPEGNSLFSVYSADSGDSQVSVLNLNRTQGKARVTFLEDKPHVKGIINSIVFPPWENTCFVTGGSDHAVIMWKETDAENVWKPKALHRNMHSSAVMGVAGMCQKQIILSAGADKRIVGFDANVGRAEFKHQIESKCMSVLPNPCDFNLFMVQAGTHEKQLRLFDIRLRQTEIHAFGWKQESSESQSALINQAWSPDGLYISSGTADPMIHIFDIRYHAHKPSQSIRAHQKRVFKAPTAASPSKENVFNMTKVRDEEFEDKGPAVNYLDANYFHAPASQNRAYDHISSPADNIRRDAAEDQGLRKDHLGLEEFSGYIFMCNGRTKPECYLYRVFGLPTGRKEIIEKISPGMKLFLFYYNLKFLYGVYEATTAGQLNLERTAFGGNFPAQVRFKIYKECLPLPESDFKHAIQDNYKRGSNKFNTILNSQQVSHLLSLFHPITMQSSTQNDSSYMNDQFQTGARLPFQTVHT